MRKYIVRGIFTALVLLFSSSHLHAYEVCTINGNNVKWSTSTATFYINTAGGPSGTITAVQAAMQTWTDVSPSDLTFVYGGTTTSTEHGVNNGNNIVTFGSLPDGTIAENRYWRFGNGSLSDSDIKFNTLYYSWSTDGTPDTMDVQNIGTHEHGHALCLMDLYNGNEDSQKTMWWSGYEGETKKRTLHQDDIDGINYIYCGEPVNVVGGSSYSSLDAAYVAAGDGGVIEVHSVVRNEDIFININKEVTIEAGYDCDFLSANGETQINSLEVTDGTLIISDGTLVVEEVVL